MFQNHRVIVGVLLGLTINAAMAAPDFNQVAKKAKSFSMSELEVQYGGYIKLDMISSDYSDGDLGAASLGRDIYVPGTIPVGGIDESRDTDFHAKESRFFMKTSSMLDGHKLRTHIELDFLTGIDGNERVTNSYKPRIRHMYFTYKRWLFGQTWSTFQNVSALPENLDFVGPAESTVFERQAMIRYSAGNFQIALENPETTVTPNGGGGRIVTDDGALPDLILRYNIQQDWGSMVIAGLLRRLDYENNATNIDDDTDALSISWSGKINVGEKDDFRFMISTGSGMGRYMGLNLVNGAVIESDGDLDAIDSTAAFVSYRHFWDNHWRSNITYSIFSADNDTTDTGLGVTESSESFHVNLLYSPVPRITFGGEIMWAEREIESGQEGDLNRLQLSAKYVF